MALYADDTVLYYFSASPTDLEEKLNSELRAVCNWLQENKLTLNIVKTKAMIIGSHWKLSDIGSVKIQVNGSCVENVESFSYLGVTISSNLTWSDHVDNLCSKINKRLGLLRRIKHLLPHWHGFCSSTVWCYHCSTMATLFGETKTTPC